MKNKICKTVVIILFVVIGLQYIFNGKKEVQQQITPLPTQEIIIPFNNYIPAIIVVKSHSTDTVERWKTVYKKDKNDSLRIIETYKKLYALNRSLDTIVNDTNALIILDDTITENKIRSRSVYKKFYIHSYQITNSITSKFRLYAGGGLEGGLNQLGVFGGVVVTSGANKAYSVSYDPILKRVNIGVYWPIKLKNRNK